MPKLYRAYSVTRRGALAGLGGSFLGSCRRPRPESRPTIQFIRVPQADEGGRDKHDIIQGRVIGAAPGDQIVLYAKSKTWSVQPLLTRPITLILPSGTWTNATHLGTGYAALLVKPGYRPAPTLADLPAAGGPLIAVSTAKGGTSPPSPIIQFSGYEWRVRDAPSARGGKSLYLPENAWTDAKGALHLKLSRASGEWTCAEVSLTRSLGYGTYSFVVRDTSKLAPSVAFSIFTWDYTAPEDNYHEMDIEISRWGVPNSKNAQYVRQPFYVPANVERFVAPGGVLTHSIRWEPGRMTFRTVRGPGPSHAGQPVAGRVLTTGVPVPAMDSVRMNLYVFKTRNYVPPENEAEVVIEKFEFLP